MNKEKVTFFSNKLKREVLAEIVELRKNIVKLLLVNGKIIIKKIRKIRYGTNK